MTPDEAAIYKLKKWAYTYRERLIRPTRIMGYACTCNLTPDEKAILLRHGYLILQGTELIYTEKFAMLLSFNSL
jgi:hypothetical protein